MCIECHTVISQRTMTSGTDTSPPLAGSPSGAPKSCHGRSSEHLTWLKITRQPIRSNRATRRLSASPSIAPAAEGGSLCPRIRRRSPLDRRLISNGNALNGTTFCPKHSLSADLLRGRAARSKMKSSICPFTADKMQRPPAWPAPNCTTYRTAARMLRATAMLARNVHNPNAQPIPPRR